MTQRENHDEKIEAIFAVLTEMFDRVDEQLADAVNALCQGDEGLALRVRERDVEVDALELKVDRACEYVLREARPTDDALLRVVAAMRINADLERIGDQCKNIAKGVPYLDPSSLWRSQTHIIDMADVVRAIVREAREAFAKPDRLLARQVLAHDRQIDREHQAVMDAIVDLCRQHPAHASTLIHLVTMSKALERIADHAKGIARSVVFFIEGVDIRHRKARRAAAEARGRP